MKYVVECTPDEALVSLLTEEFRREIMHRSNKPEVLKYVRRAPDTIGLIDDDPLSIQPPLIRELVEIESLPHLGLRRSKFQNNNIVITLSPRLEEWTLAACRQSSVRPERYGLPSDSFVFHDVVNQRIDNFRRLVSDIKSDSERFRVLSNWLRQTRL